MWAALAGRRGLGGWRWQVPFGPYILDFLCREAGVVVELDGGQHSERIEYDARRTAYLERAGLTVVRFWNDAVLTNRAGVCDSILAICGGERPSPPPRAQRTEREGIKGWAGRANSGWRPKGPPPAPPHRALEPPSGAPPPHAPAHPLIPSPSTRLRRSGEGRSSS